MRLRWRLLGRITLTFWLWYYLPYVSSLFATPFISLSDPHPAQGYAPLSTTLRVVVEPNSMNRGVCLVWDSEEGQSSRDCWQLDGADAARTKFYVIKGLSAGDYLIQATLYRSVDEVKSNVEEVKALGRE